MFEKDHVIISMFILICIVAVASITSAQNIEHLGTFKQDSCIGILQTCANCTFVNITSVISDFRGKALGNRAMTKMGFEYNYTFCNTSVLSPYTYWTVGDVDGTETVVGVTFDVTADGNPTQDFPTQFIFIALAVIFVFIGTLNDKLSLFQNLGAALLMVMGVLTLYPGYSFINHTTLTGLGLGTVLIGLGFWFLIEKSFSGDRQVETYDYADDGRLHDD